MNWQEHADAEAARIRELKAKARREAGPTPLEEWSAGIGRAMPHAFDPGARRAAQAPADVVAEWNATKGIGGTESEEALRKQLSAAHPDHGGDATEFQRLKKRLDRKRGR